MSLHTDWVAAKNDSKAKFKQALKAKKDALAKNADKGDAKAKAKYLDMALSDLGMDKGDDLDKYFTFREELGPNLDKLEKAHAHNDQVKQAKKAITGIAAILNDSKLSKAFASVAKAKGLEDFWKFITEGYKSDPVRAYDTYIKVGAPMEINIDQEHLQPMRALAGNNAQLKVQGPAMLQTFRTKLIAELQRDALMKFLPTKECTDALGGLKDTADLKKRVTDAIDSYKQQIQKYQAKWKNHQPDFRKPLTDALGKIETAVGGM